MTTTYSTFEAFRPHFNALAYVAYFKIVPRPSLLKHTLHTAARAVVWFLVIIYNLQNVIRIIQARHSMEQLAETLYILLSTLNVLGKQVAFNSRVERIDRLIATIEGPLFAACNAYDEKMLRSNARIMSRLLMMYHGSVIICCAMFGISPLVTKLSSGDAKVMGYYPFDTSGWIGFGIAIVYNTIVLTMQAYAHSTMDCTIISMHAQATTQLQMLRNSLEHLVDPVADAGREICVRSTIYKDIEDAAFGVVVKKRLTRCVMHYKLILWFHNEVEALFAEALMVQFFVAAWVICMSVYKAVGLSLLSAEFFTTFLYLSIMMAQLFIYCYYGSQVKAESEFINCSIYQCDWMSLSPRFRALLLILMSRGMRPVAPRIAGIIPMSLETYISVLRSSYTLFACLARK